MSRRCLALALLALLLAPPALGHGGPEDEDRYYASRPDNEGPRPEPKIPEGYTGPGREPYLSYFEGVWLYGAVTATPLGAQRPVDLDVDGDWVVWEDANRSDIYAYNIPAGQGYYITTDTWRQHHPRVSEGVVVYEDHRDLARTAVYAHFLETGETRRLSNSRWSATEPDIDYPLVAWLDSNLTNPDVWAYSLANQTAWNLHPGTDRDSSPVVVGDSIYWRTYRYNLFDIVGYDTFREEEIQVTTDSAIQSAPFSNGKDLLFMTNIYESGWAVDRFDKELGIVRRTPLQLPDSTRVSASGEGLLRVTLDVDYMELVVRNLTTGANNHVSGNLILASSAVIQDHTIFAPAKTKNGVSLMILEASPFAFAKRPTLAITSPQQNTPWVRPLVVTGILSAGPEFTEPTTFTYRLSDQPPQVIPVAREWRFTLDPAGMPAGRHIVTVRATFREGPPLGTSVVLNIAAPSESVDVERAGPAFHAARLMDELNFYILDNPAAWVLIPLVFVIAALALFRAWLWFKPRRHRSVVEYVPPDDA